MTLSANMGLDRYWRPNFTDAEAYRFVDAAVAAGYSVLSYDRIGVGTSSKYVRQCLPPSQALTLTRAAC